MKLQRRLPIVIAGFAIFFCVSCFDLVVSLEPWFDVDDEALAEPRLAGSWCLDDATDRMEFVAGPGDSWNVFTEGKLGFRVWLAEIDGVRYLDWMTLCEPSRDTEEDDCREPGLPLGSHLLAQITLEEEDRIEFRLLEPEPFWDLLEYREYLGQPLEYGRVESGLVVLADRGVLGELVAEHGGQSELWSEETLEMTRHRAGRPLGQ